MCNTYKLSPINLLFCRVYTFYFFLILFYLILYTLYFILDILYFILYTYNVSPIGLSAINVFATLGPGPVSNQHQIRAIPATRLTPSLSSLTSSSSLSLLTSSLSWSSSSLSWSSSSPSSLTSSSSTPVSSSAASTQTQSQSYGNTDGYY